MSIQEKQIGLPNSVSEARRSDVAAGVLLALCSLFRFWYAGRHELLQDEAYYWQWSRHLDWGYYDNTPLLAVVIRVFTGLLGTSELGVRAGAVTCAALVSLFVYLLAKRLFGNKTALLALILATIIPVYAGGAVLMTQDPVQLALWAATLYVVHGAIAGKKGLWYVAGLLAGLAAQAKLNALLLLPSIFLYLLLAPSARERWLRRPEPYLAGVLALGVFAPFVWWDHTHQNAFSLHIHAMGSRSSAHDGLKWLGRFLGDQALILAPLLYLTYLYSLYDGARRGIRERDEALLFVWCPSAVVFTATALISLRSKVEANWAVAAYVTGTILVAVTLLRIWERRPRGGKAWVLVSCTLAVVISGVALFPGAAYRVGLKYHDPTKDRTNELHGWHELAGRVAQEQAAMPPGAFVFGINYRMPSEAAFYLAGHPKTYSLFLHDRSNEYMFWEDPKKLVGRDAVFINDTDAPDHLGDVRAVFDRVDPQTPLLIYRDPPYGGKPIRTIQVFRCHGFKGYDVRRWQDGW